MLWAAADLLLVVGGMLLWTLMEYWIHRMLGHNLDTRCRTRHLAHHAAPRDYRFEPLWPLGFMILVALALIVNAYFFFLAIGIAIGWIRYEYIHWMLHEPHLPERLESLKQHHEAHHQLSGGNYGLNFGVSTDWWDVVFNTDA